VARPHCARDHRGENHEEHDEERFEEATHRAGML
jgi:hypothetical protein